MYELAQIGVELLAVRERLLEYEENLNKEAFGADDEAQAALDEVFSDIEKAWRSLTSYGALFGT